MTITLGPDLSAALNDAARRQGVPPDVLALNVLRERFLTHADTPCSCYTSGQGKERRKWKGG